MKIYLFLLIALISCGIQQQTKNMPIAYHDIDLFNLRGIDVMDAKSIQYPYILINTINKTERLIEYYLTEKIKYSRHYFYKDGYWKSEYELKDAGDYYYEYILPGDTIVTFMYDGNPTGNSEFKLLSLEVLNKKNIIKYLYEDSIKVLPTEDYQKLINENVNAVKTTTLYNADNKFKIEETLKDYKSDSIIAINKRCYNIGAKSYFWFFYFGSTSLKVLCD